MNNKNYAFIKGVITSKLFLPGLIFFSVNLSFSYMFYHVNSFKMAIVGLGVTILFFVDDIFKFRKLNKNEFKDYLRIIGTIFIPIIATIPGLVYHKFNYNYNFEYELAAFLFLIAWAGYLYRRVQNFEDMYGFFYMVALTLIYVSLRSYMERIGIDPFLPASIRVKSTFGNTNYFAAFLIVVIPFIATLAVPVRVASEPGQKLTWLFDTKNKFFFIVFLLSIIALYLTQTRAAIVAVIIALICGLIIFSTITLSKKWQRIIFLAITISITLDIILIVLISTKTITLPGYLSKSRFVELLTQSTWYGRTIAWETAITAIKASPWIGYGLGSSYNLFFKFVLPESRLFYTERSYNHVHCEPLEYIQEAGFIGLILFLAFWVYIAYMMIKILRSQDVAARQKILTIGIIGGFIAYNVHGFFEVAPRMMVMRFPFYTLLAFAFILYNLHKGISTGMEKTNKGIQLKIVGISFLLLAGAWFLYSPWLYKQNALANIIQNPDVNKQAYKLEKLLIKEGYTDIYALERLAIIQLKTSRLKNAEETLKKIDAVIPGYRQVGLLKAHLVYKQHDIERSIQLAKEFQKTDLYNPDAAQFLIFAAAVTGKRDLFFEQLKLLLSFNIYKENYTGAKKIDFINMYEEAGIQNLKIEFRDNNQKADFIWPSEFIDSLSQYIKSSSKGHYINPQELSEYISSIVRKSKYFDLSLGDIEEDARQKIFTFIKAYFSLSADLKNKKRDIAEKYNKKLKDLNDDNHEEILHKKKYEIKDINNSYKIKMNSFKNLINQEIDFDAYLKKKELLDYLVKTLRSLVYFRI